MLTDAQIQVEKSVAKRIAQVICEEIKRSIAANAKVYNRATRNMNAYNQVTKYTAQNRICDKPWLGAADYFIGLIEWTIDAVWARVMSTLFAKEPYMSAVGETADDKPREDGVTDFVDAILREKVRLYDNSNYLFKQSLNLPFSVAKYEWVSDYDNIMRKEKAYEFVSPEGKSEYLLPDDEGASIKAMEFAANGYQQTSEMVDVWTLEDVELYNAPRLQYVSFEDYVWSPNAKKDTLLYWEGDRFWLTLNDMKRQAKQKKFIEDSVTLIVQQSGINSMAAVDKDIAQRAELKECFNWYGKLPFNSQGEVSFEDQDAIEQEVICVVAFKEQELLQIKYWDNRRLPYPNRVYLRLLFEETDNFEGRSLTDKLYMTNKELNNLHNTIQNNAMIAMQKILVKKRNLVGDEWAKPTIYPGAVFTEDQTGDIRVLDMGDVKRIGMELEQSLLSFAERMSNVSIYTTGASRSEGGQKTLGEVQRVVYEGNIGMDKYIQRCHNVLREICKWTVDYYYDRMPPGLERRIRGEENALIFPSPENMQVYQQKGIKPYWSQDDIAGQFDFVWRGTSLNSSKEWDLAVANDLQERYLPHPMISGNMLATWEILKRGLLARGIKDWDTILPKKEALMAEMKAMEQKRQQMKQEQAGSNIKRKVVEKMQQRGMSPMQADQAAGQMMAQTGMQRGGMSAQPTPVA